MILLTSSVSSSKLVTGTTSLIQDLTTVLIVLAPIVGTLLCIYFFIRRGGADEMEVKKWNNRIMTTIISVIGAVITGATLTILIGYYS